MEAFVHMTGYVGSDVEVRNSTATIASFRLACTPRIRRGGDWVDAQTTWLNVTCSARWPTTPWRASRRATP